MPGKCMHIFCFSMCLIIHRNCTHLWFYFNMQAFIIIKSSFSSSLSLFFVLAILILNAAVYIKDLTSIKKIFIINLFYMNIFCNCVLYLPSKIVSQENIFSSFINTHTNKSSKYFIIFTFIKLNFLHFGVYVLSHSVLFMYDFEFIIFY